MQNITPCLWFDTQAEEAVQHYSAIFASARTLRTTHFGEGTHRPADLVLTIEFELEGQRFMALNGGPEFHFTPAISLAVDARPKTKSIAFGSVWAKAATPTSAAGCKTNSVCRGSLCPPCCPHC